METFEKLYESASLTKRSQLKKHLRESTDYDPELLNMMEMAVRFLEDICNHPELPEELALPGRKLMDGMIDFLAAADEE